MRWGHEDLEALIPNHSYHHSLIPGKLCLNPQQDEECHHVIVDHGATQQTFWLANSPSLCVFSTATFYWDDVIIFLGGISLCWPHAKGHPALQTLVKPWKKQVSPTVNHLFFFSYQARRMSWSGVTKHIYLCRRSFYPFLDRMLAPHLKLGENATCSHFSAPFLPTLSWDYLQDFRHWFTTTVWCSNEDNRSLKLRPTAPCNPLCLPLVFCRQE